MDVAKYRAELEAELSDPAVFTGTPRQKRLILDGITELLLIGDSLRRIAEALEKRQ